MKKFLKSPLAWVLAAALLVVSLRLAPLWAVYAYLTTASLYALATTATYMGIYGRIIDWRNKVGKNAWLGGFAGFILALTSLMFAIGHYLEATTYYWPLLVAAVGFTVLGVVWHVRSVLVWKISHENDDRDTRG